MRSTAFWELQAAASGRTGSYLIQECKRVQPLLYSQPPLGPALRAPRRIGRTEESQWVVEHSSSTPGARC